MSSKLKTILNNPSILFTALAKRGFWNWIPDKTYLKILYRVCMGEKLDLKNPIKFNQKIQWLKLNDRKEEYHLFVDKAAVKDYVAEKIGREYIIPTLGVWDTVEDIDFEALPNQFVLKCTHDSGSVVICKEKASFDIQSAKEKLKKSLKRDYYYTYREWVYKGVPRKIIAEPYLEELSSGDLIDYKVFCFDGKAQMIEIHQNRFTGKIHTQDFYDVDWNNMHIEQPGWPTSNESISRPKCLKSMIQFSEELSKGMILSRIDWYAVEDKLLFGEITFYDGSGLQAFWEKDEIELGERIKLNL